MAVSSKAPGPACAPLRVGVIGAGRIGRMHAELLARSVPGAKLQCVHDVDERRARPVADALGVRLASSLEQVLASDVDAVAICSSTNTHADLLTASARAGKAIFCEKPVSLDLNELDRALAEVRASQVPFQIGFNRRFDRAHAAVRRAVAVGEVGDVELLRITSRDPEPPPLDYVKVSGGLFLDMTIHDFDMARFVTGSEVTEVYARGAVRIDPAFAQAGDLDTALITLVHENGCLTAIDNSRRAAYGYDQRVEAFGSLGMAASCNPRQHTTLVQTASGGHLPTLQEFFLERYADSYRRQWEHFIATVHDPSGSEGQLSDARAPLVIGLAAWRSVRECRPVSIVEVEG